ncbi:MAG: hypothetical protein Q7S65_04530 [Nanoarchaeota archaeon]|nr:hypothetical protein [Nanoarchaeota archaeon]
MLTGLLNSAVSYLSGFTNRVKNAGDYLRDAEHGRVNIRLRGKGESSQYLRSASLVPEDRRGEARRGENRYRMFLDRKRAGTVVHLEEGMFADGYHKVFTATGAISYVRETQRKDDRGYATLEHMTRAGYVRAVEERSQRGTDEILDLLSSVSTGIKTTQIPRALEQIAESERRLVSIMNTNQERILIYDQKGEETKEKVYVSGDALYRSTRLLSAFAELQRKRELLEAYREESIPAPDLERSRQPKRFTLRSLAAQVVAACLAPASEQEPLRTALSGRRSLMFAAFSVPLRTASAYSGAGLSLEAYTNEEPREAPTPFQSSPSLQDTLRGAQGRAGILANRAAFALEGVLTSGSQRAMAGAAYLGGAARTIGALFRDSYLGWGDIGGDIGRGGRWVSSMFTSRDTEQPFEMNVTKIAPIPTADLPRTGSKNRRKIPPMPGYHFHDAPFGLDTLWYEIRRTLLDIKKRDPWVEIQIIDLKLKHTHPGDWPNGHRQQLEERRSVLARQIETQEAS